MCCLHKYTWLSNFTYLSFMTRWKKEYWYLLSLGASKFSFFKISNGHQTFLLESIACFHYLSVLFCILGWSYIWANHRARDPKGDRIWSSFVWGVFFHCVLLLPPPTSVSLSHILSRFLVTLSGRKVDVLVSSYPSKISRKEYKCFAKIICSTYIHLMWTSHYLFLICCISFQLLNYHFYNQIYGNEMLYSYFKPYKSHTI